jgi:hypothetical protein
VSPNTTQTVGPPATLGGIPRAYTHKHVHKADRYIEKRFVVARAWSHRLNVGGVFHSEFREEANHPQAAQTELGILDTGGVGHVDRGAGRDCAGSWHEVHCIEVAVAATHLERRGHPDGLVVARDVERIHCCVVITGYVCWVQWWEISVSPQGMVGRGTTPRTALVGRGTLKALSQIACFRAQFQNRESLAL